MDIFLLILSILLILLGVAGCIIPALPGPPLSFLGILLLEFTRFGDAGLRLLLFLGILAAVVQVLDFVVPVWGTRRFGGTKYGTWGSIIGLIAGLFFIPAIGPLGIFTILGGPFLGAYLGEKLANQSNNQALRAAFGSFIGFLAGTLMKFASAIIITFFYIREIVQYIKA